MAKELDTTIVIGTETYKVNAEHAKEADKVKNSLSLNKTNLNKNPASVLDFNGEQSKSLTIVPANGGRFSGRITVPSSSSDIWKSDGETVLNYTDIVDTILKDLENTSVLCTWDGATLSGIDDGSLVQSISIITGADSEVNTLANEIFENKPVAAYVYIADNGNIYFGTSASNEVKSVQVSAENSIKANQLANSRNLIVSLAKDGNDAKNTKFDGTSDVTLGISGILQPKHGGTGATDLGSVIVGYARQLQDASDGRKTADAVDVINNTDSINNIISGATTVAKAVTAENATKLGNQVASYYQKKIFTGTNAPTNASIGDIWIKY